MHSYRLCQHRRHHHPYWHHHRSQLQFHWPHRLSADLRLRRRRHLRLRLSPHCKPDFQHCCRGNHHRRRRNSKRLSPKWNWPTRHHHLLRRIPSQCRLRNLLHHHRRKPTAYSADRHRHRFLAPVSLSHQPSSRWRNRNHYRRRRNLLLWESPPRTSLHLFHRRARQAILGRLPILLKARRWSR